MKPWQVGQLFDRKWNPEPVRDRLVGIELEYEGVVGVNLIEQHGPSNVTNFVTPRWQAVRDGSLRNNGAEFVSTPIPVSTVRDALRELFRAHEWGRWQLSVRTGLHVHCDVRDYTLDQLRVAATAYCLIEPALFNYVGMEREESVFCIPWYRAHADCLRLISRLDMKTDPQTKIVGIREPTFSKYDAVNWCPINRLGTIEFRHAPNTLDQNRIATWAEVCVAVLQLGKTHTQQQLLQIYLDNIDAFPDFVHVALAMRDYESVMLKSGAEWLANRTLLQPEPDLKDPKSWVRVNDTLSVVRDRAEIPRRYQTPPPLPPVGETRRLRTPAPRWPFGAEITQAQQVAQTPQEGFEAAVVRARVLAGAAQPVIPEPFNDFYDNEPDEEI